MNSVYFISVPRLVMALTLVLVVLLIHIRWSLKIKGLSYGTFRMLLQLFCVGYILTFIFQSQEPGIICSVLAIMLAAASWISLRPLKNKSFLLYRRVLASLTIGGILVLVVITQGVIRLDPWYQPRYLIPLAGMVFANSMNAVSLAAERFFSELQNEKSYLEARNTAYQAALIPVINSFYAVGLVSFPGMMTGQILSGISPLIAARYQIMVMCMVLGGAGISTALFLIMSRDQKAPQSV